VCMLLSNDTCCDTHTRAWIDFFPGDYVSASSATNGTAQESNQAGNNVLNVATMTELDNTLDAFLGTTTGVGSSEAAVASRAQRPSEANSSALLRRSLGIVTRVDFDAQTCDVRWLREDSDHPILERDIPVGLRVFVFFFCMLTLCVNTHTAQTFTLEAHVVYEELRLEDVVCLMPDHPLLKSGVGMAWAGTVEEISLETGDVRVLWADGSETTMPVEALYRIDPEPLLDMWHQYYHGSDDEEEEDDGEDDDEDELDGGADDSDDSSNAAGGGGPFLSSPMFQSLSHLEIGSFAGKCSRK
jgi:hypothetical protein